MNIFSRPIFESISKYVGFKPTLRGALLLLLMISHAITLYALPNSELQRAFSTLTGTVIFLFIPGYLIASTRTRGPTETIVSSVGLSVILLSLTGFILNFALPVAAPLKYVPAVILVMTTVLIVRFEGSAHSYTRLTGKLAPKRRLVWLLLPVLATVGGFLLSTREFNLVSIASIPLIGIGGLLLVYDSPSDSATTGLGAYCVFLSLMLLNSASIQFISGYGDAHKEFHAAREVISAGSWQPAESAVSTLASVKLFVPVIAMAGDIPLPIVFKFVVPLIYALTGPLMYLLYLNKFNEQVAALATLITAFGSAFLFSPVISGLSRQSLALFFALFFVYLLLDTRTYRSMGEQALLIGSLSVTVVFHYSVSFLYSLLIVMGVISVPVVKAVATRTPLINPPDIPDQRRYKLLFVPTLLFLIFTLSYYYFINAHVYSALSSRIYQLYIFFFGVTRTLTNQAVSSGARSLPYEVLKYLYLLEVVFIGLGLLYILYSSETDVRLEYTTIAGVFYGMLGVVVIGPYLFFGIERVFTLMVPILAPFLAVGFTKLAGKLPAFNIPRAQATLSIILIFALLLNSGWVMEVTNSYPNSPGLSQASMSDENYDERVKFYNHFQDFSQDKHLAVFFRERTNYQTDGIYIDGLSSYLLRSYGGGDPSPRNWFVEGSRQFPVERLNTGSYVMLGYVNTQMDTYAKLGFGPPERYSHSDIRPLLLNTSKIYDNGASVAYKKTS